MPRSPHASRRIARRVLTVLLLVVAALVAAPEAAALLATGENPQSSKWNGRVDALLAFQDERGAFRQDDEADGEDLDGTIAEAYWPVLPTA